MHIHAIKTKLYTPDDVLSSFLFSAVKTLPENTIVAITSKIIALSEKRISTKGKEDLIKKESTNYITTPYGYITYTAQGWGINAGIDESNAPNARILLPRNPFKTAWQLRTMLVKHYKLQQCGVIITDTRSSPLRKGTMGRAIGYSGFIPFKNYIGKKDLYGRKSRFTISNSADSLAAAAVMTMGEGNEQTPLAIIKQAPVVFISRPLTKNEKQLNIPIEHDIFLYAYKHHINKNKK